MSYIHICEGGASVRIVEGRLQVDSRDGMRRSIPLEQLEGVTVYGGVEMSSACWRELLRRGIPVSLLSSTGAFFGRLESTRHVNITRQRMQFKRGEDDDFRLGFAVRIVESKVHNQIVLLRRYNRHRNFSGCAELIAQMEAIENRIPACMDIQQLMGYEGTAARHYFKALSILVDEDFKFSGRNRMPPRDPFNSMLSLGYTLLMQEAMTAIVNKGLNPYAGFFHSDREGHPALASDMIEEWRPVLVDSLVMSLISGGEVKIDGFVRDEDSGGVFLKKETLRHFVRGFERKLMTEAGYLSEAGGRMSFRRAIAEQVGALCRAIENGDPSVYRPVRLR